MSRVGLRESLCCVRGRGNFFRHLLSMAMLQYKSCDHSSLQESLKLVWTVIFESLLFNALAYQLHPARTVVAHGAESDRVSHHYQPLPCSSDSCVKELRRQTQCCQSELQHVWGVP